MAATGLQMNWSAVGMTVASTLTTLTKIDGIDIDYGTEMQKYSGDADRFNTTIVNAMNDPKFNVKSSNVAQLLALVGVTGTFSATHNDAKLASGGGIVYSLINAVCGNVTAGGQHAQFGGGSIEIMATSSDGVTSPLSFTRA